MTPQERIAFLLEHFHDVLAGVRDRGLGGEHVPLMCRAWNAPCTRSSSGELPLLCVEARPLYRAVVGQFVYPACASCRLPQVGHCQAAEPRG